MNRLPQDSPFTPEQIESACRAANAPRLGSVALPLHADFPAMTGEQFARVREEALRLYAREVVDPKYDDDTAAQRQLALDCFRRVAQTIRAGQN